MADDGFDEDLSVSVVDVYDLASEIGKEFEKLIDHFGTDSVTSLMPKVNKYKAIYLYTFYICFYLDINRKKFQIISIIYIKLCIYS